ncbi:MAG: hypothetical protein HRF42_10270 [Candidatus Brocadia sp.]|jgi:hypothetical protein
MESFDVNTNSNICSWQAYSDASWITITSGSSGTGSGTVYYSVDANSSSGPRTGTITVYRTYSYIFTVTQSGASEKSDLVIQNLTVSPNSGYAGSSATVSFTIYNQGGGTANPSTTNIRINTSSGNVTTSDPLLASISIPSIPAGGSYPVSQTVTIPGNQSSGTNYIWVILDVNARQTRAANQTTRQIRYLRLQPVKPNALPTAVFPQAQMVGHYRAISGLV